MRFTDESQLVCNDFIVDKIDGLSHALSDIHSNVIKLIQPQSSLCRYADDSKLSEALWQTLNLNHPGIRNQYDRALLWLPASTNQDSTYQPTGTVSVLCKVDETRPKTHIERYYDFQEQNESLLLYGRRFRDIFPLSPEKHDIPAKIFNDIRLTAISLIGRRVMTSESGFLGLVPKAAEHNDVIAVILGCNFPVVLRPHGRTYKVIGECYVHGLMEGEVFDLQYRRECLLEEVVLS